MPYILSNDGRREALIIGDIARNPGELNFQIFHYVKYQGSNTIDYSIIRFYVRAFLGEHPNYQKYNDMTGCLIRCYKEIERRLGFKMPMLIDIMDSYDNKIADYEDVKIKSNGDV